MKQISLSRGFSVLEIILLVALAALVACGAVYVFNRDSSTAKPLTASQPTGEALVQQPTYLTIKELGVKLPVENSLMGLKYRMVDENNAGLTTAKLEQQAVGKKYGTDLANCSYGAIGSIIRYDHQPTSDENPFLADTAKVGSYYYGLTIPDGGPCSSDPAVTKTWEGQIEGVKQAFKQLRTS